MSLINDALKRARVEALRQEAGKEGVEYRAIPAHSRQGRWSAGQLAGWTVAAIAIGLLLWVSMRPAGRPEDGEATATEGRAVTPETTSDPDSVEPLSVGQTRIEAPGVDAPLFEAASVASSSAPPPLAPPESARRNETPEESAGALDAASTAAPDGTDSAARPQQGVRLEDGAVYLRRATATDGSAVELGGIAFSEDRPIAVINGSVVSPGDMIAGFTIVSIGPERVELESDGVRIYLSLH